MAIKKYRPTSPGRRGMTSLVRALTNRTSLEIEAITPESNGEVGFRYDFTARLGTLVS